MISLRRSNSHSRVNHVERDVEWISRDAALSGEPIRIGADWHIVGCRDSHTVDENEQPLKPPFGAFWAIYSRP
jgi:hypothetical protein